MKNNMRRTSYVGCPFLIHIGGGFMKDISVRALKTFWQSAVAYLVATLSTQGMDVFERDVIGGLLSLSMIPMFR